MRVEPTTIDVESDSGYELDPYAPCVLQMPRRLSIAETVHAIDEQVRAEVDLLNVAAAVWPRRES